MKRKSISILVLLLLVLFNSCSILRCENSYRPHCNRVYLAYITHKPVMMRLSDLNLDSLAIYRISYFIDTNEYYFLKMNLLNLAVYETMHAKDLRNFSAESPNDSVLKSYYTNVCYYSKRKSDINRLIRCYENNNLIINSLSGFGSLHDSLNDLQFLDSFKIYKKKCQLNNYIKYGDN